MKKLLTIFLIIVMTLSLSVGVFAEQTATESEQIVEETSNKITQILGISGTVGISAIIIAVIAFFLSNFKKIQGVVNSMASVFKNIFSKDGSIENVPQAFNNIKTDIKDLAKNFNNDLDVVKAKLESAETKNDQLMQILSVFIINCSYINPYAKNELIQLMSGTKEFGESVSETIKRIEESVALAKASEEKIETPYLDIVTSEVE